MSEQQTIEFLIEQFGRFAAQGLRAEALMGFDLIDDQFDLPAFVIEHDQVEGRGLHGVQQRGDEPMHAIDLAMQAFFRRVKAGETPGYPRFRGRDRYDSFCFPQSGFSLTHDNRVTLSKIGSVKMVYHRPLKGSLKTCTIHRCSTGKWYVSFSVECEPERLPHCPEEVGVDVGLKTFATLSNAEEIANPIFFRKEEKALATVQRKHSKLAKGTPQRSRHRKVVARVHERIAFRRDTFTHQASRQIVNRIARDLRGRLARQPDGASSLSGQEHE